MCRYFRWLVPALVLAAAFTLSMTPATAGASAAVSEDHCSPAPVCEDIASQYCCASPACQLYYCSQPGKTENNVAPSFRSVPRPGVCSIIIKILAHRNDSSKIYIPTENSPVQDFPLHLYTSHFCRNSLSSEEPALL